MQYLGVRSVKSVGLSVLTGVTLAGAARRVWKRTRTDRLLFTSLIVCFLLYAGYGLVWNPGGPRVEGYTNPLWVLYMALVHLLPIPAPRISLLGFFVVLSLATRQCRPTR